ncbi:MAG TPA: hypothetical protein DIS90_05425 [Cytophagales bacterium]|nr:hypothetical protein [Cytophagales bacterium]HCR52939.1 hypothetical protein [Cytophagales bacterium]
MRTIFLEPYDQSLDDQFRAAASECHPEFHQADWENMNKRLDQMEKSEKISRAIMADKFIELANEFTKTESKERVGAAIMFAAARYNAFEASSKSENLRKDKNDALDWYTREYKRMLDANMDDLIDMQT